MRLINTSTLEFREFFDSEIPEYAILSHRWGSDEASYQDFEKGIQHTRMGFAKIGGCCSLALKYKFEWTWVDTCCIDKRSSAELSEAINSMYNWYRDAEVCYVYLADVLWEDGTPELHQASMDRFRRSNWFTRGWTLQELLAPDHVSFLDRRWRSIGTKRSMIDEISKITRIDAHYLCPSIKTGPFEVEICTKQSDCRAHYYSYEASIATKMSWASKRQTSRTEDIAYCLLGLFDVNMPLLYGEGSKAFRRLQYEIIKQSSDDSIFAWEPDSMRLFATFAPHPSRFAYSRYVHQTGPTTSDRRPYSMTNQGLNFPITWRGWDPEAKILKVRLDCGTCSPQGFQNFALHLKYLSRGGIWYREKPTESSLFLDQSSPDYYEISPELMKGLWYCPLEPDSKFSQGRTVDADIAKDIDNLDNSMSLTGYAPKLPLSVRIESEVMIGQPNLFWHLPLKYGPLPV
ncbi:MAG: hypothetical protein LQ341_005822 [Variospora aurantia]|nr:MAG: hypothetical protein LQ341_005822 [Variospora aurantia]